MNQQRFQFSGVRMAAPRQAFTKTHMYHQQQQQQQFQSPQHQFSKPVVDVAKDTEKLQNDQQRLASLHTKLHKEAEKIRHWKSEKEMEIKQKEKNLVEASSTIETLRKSIIDLQFKNEEFSTKLNDKEIEKAETEQKLCTVREMANVLRDQMVQLEGRIQKGEQDKDDVIKINQKMLNDHQNLVLKFQELDISQAAMVEKNANELKTLTDNHEAQKNELQSNIRHLENQVITLMQTKTTQETTINEYKKKFVENEDHIAKLSKELEDKSQKLTTAEQMVNQQEQELSKLNQTYNELSLTCKKTIESLEEYQKKAEYLEEVSEKHRSKAEEMQAICTKEINSLQNDAQELKGTIEEKNSQIDSLKVQKRDQDEAITMLQQQISTGHKKELELTTQINDANDQINALKTEETHLISKIEQLNTKIEQSHEQIQTLTKVNEEMTEKINQSCHSLSNLSDEKSTLLKIIEDAKQQISLYQNKEIESKSVNDNMNAKLKEMEINLSEKNSKIEQLIQQKEESQSYINAAQEDISKYQCEIKALENLKTEFELTINQKNEALESATKEVESLQETLTVQNEKIELLSHEGQKNQEQMQSELADKERKAEDLGNKTKSMKTEINEKTKHIKNIEKENKSLRTQLKNKTEKNDQLQDEVERHKDEFSKIKTKIVETEKLLEESRLALTSAQTNFDLEQKEFCSTLEQYKKENDKIVADHQKENNLLKQQMEQMKNSFTTEFETIKNQLDEKDNMLVLQNKRVEELQLGLTKKDTQELKIDELKRLLEESKSDLRSNEEKTKGLEKELEETLEKLEQEKIEKEKLQIKSNRKNEDRVVPTTPKAYGIQTPKTPNTLKSKREKRVLFADASQNNESCMDVDDELPIQSSNLKTPTLPNKPKPKSVRYSPKDSPALEAKSPKTPIFRIGKKSKGQQDILSLVSAHQEAVKNNSSVHDEKPAASPNIFKMTSKRVSSPASIRHGAGSKNKMKKIMKKPEKLERDFSWFESDKNFAFTE